MRRIHVELVAGGPVTGPFIELDEPVSFWGGVDPASGRIVDRNHPQCGLEVTGMVVLMRGSRGSSSSSSTLLECARLGTSPAALLMTEREAVLSVGALVAWELYGQGPAVAIVPAGTNILPGSVARISPGVLVILEP